MVEREDIATNVKIDVHRHTRTIGYIGNSLQTIYITNNKSWFNGKFLEKNLVSTISHETIHLVLMKIAIEEELRGKERIKMYRGIDYKFKMLGRKTMNKGNSDYHGLDNIDNIK